MWGSFELLSFSSNLNCVSGEKNQGTERKREREGGFGKQTGLGMVNNGAPNRQPFSAVQTAERDLPLAKTLCGDTSLGAIFLRLIGRLRLCSSRSGSRPLRVQLVVGL